MIEGTKTVICGFTRKAVSEILKWIKNRAESSTDKLFLIKDKESNTNIGTIGLKNVELFISIGNIKLLS